MGVWVSKWLFSASILLVILLMVIDAYQSCHRLRATVGY